jgi:hypothetical protein
MAALTALAIGTAIGGFGLQAYGQHKAGQAAKSAGEAQAAAAESEAQLSEFNAGVADLQAKDAIERGAEQESRFRTQVKGLIGTQRAGQASGNVDVNYGSTVDVQADTARLGELDALTLRTNAMREAWGYSVEAADLRTRAEITRKGGAYALQAGEEAATTANWQAAGTIASGTGSLLMQRYGFKDAAPTSRASAVDASPFAGNITGGGGLPSRSLPKGTLVG